MDDKLNMGEETGGNGHTAYAPLAERTRLTAAQRIAARRNATPSQNSTEAALAIVASAETVATELERIGKWFLEKAATARQQAKEKAEDITKFGHYMFEIDAATQQFLEDTQRPKTDREEG